MSSFVDSQLLSCHPQLSNPKFNDSIKRKVLLLLIMDVSQHKRDANDSLVYRQIANHKTWQKYEEEEEAEEPPESGRMVAYR